MAAAAAVASKRPRARSNELRPLDPEAGSAVEGCTSRTSNLMDLLQKEQAEQEQSAASQHWLLESTVFHATIAVLILTNTIVMGLEADYPEWVHVWKITEHFFTAAFSLELIFKLWILRRHYFRDSANLLDFALVVCAMTDTWILQLVGGSVDLQSLTILRLMRIFRLARIIRLIKHCENLLVILSGVVDAMRSTFWVSLILFAVIYACAIFCTDFIGNGEPTLYPGYAAEDWGFDSSTIMKDFNPYVCFGSMSRSMFTLFNMVILSEWAEITRPLMAKQPYFVLFFIVFVICTTFGLMNVVVGMIVDSVMTHVNDVMAETQENEVKRKLKMLSELQKYMDVIDRNHDGKVTLAELEVALKQPGMQSLIKDVKLPRDILPHELFAMLDSNGDGALVGDEFVRGFYRLVEGNSFQHACMNQISFNSLKSMVQQQLEVAMQTRDLVCHFNANLEELRAEVRASLGSLRGLVVDEEGVFNASRATSSKSKVEPENDCAEVTSQPSCVLRRAAPQLQPGAYSAEGLSIERDRATVPIVGSTADLGPNCRMSPKEEEPKEPSLALALPQQCAPLCMREQQACSPEAQDNQSLTRLHGQQLLIKPRGSSAGLGQQGEERLGEGDRAVGKAFLRRGHGPQRGGREELRVSI